ncbi:hypothetical protein J2X32_003779 [Rheinheimera pacifica]|uniref:hypothetical protein n=1 Tax=Rheinheimera pacifica TaxID=173990 RepID=UPI00285FF1AB|nr:hypothetical protein [Rheinheimera pacifica]MDR6985122.1 hypothetical protein [Rheinheimera pacifica]
MRTCFFLMAMACLSIMPNRVVAQGPGWTVVSEVTEVVTVSSGGLNVRLTPDLTGCESQSGYGQHHASIYPDHHGINLFQSNLLAAMISGKKVTLYFTDNKCRVSEMRIFK